MKKLLVLLCAVAMLCTMAVTASADTVGTAYTIEYDGISINIDIIDDFSSYEEMVEVPDDGCYTFGDGKLVWDVFVNGYNWGFAGAPASPIKQIAGIEDAYNAATYTGFQVKNTGDADAVIAFEDLAADPVQWATQTWVMDGIKLVSADGVVDAQGTELLYRRFGINIPAGFDGWLFVPFTSFKIHQADADSYSQVNFDAVFDMPSFCGTAIGDNEEGFAVLEIDNIFLSSADLSQFAGPEATEEATEEATTEATEEATTEVTEEATTEATEEATTEATEEATIAPQEPANDSTLIILIVAAAVVVIAAVIIFVVVKKKKNA